MKFPPASLPTLLGRVFTFSVAGLAAATVSLEASTPSRFRMASARNLMNGFAPEMLASDSLHANERAFLTKAVETCQQQMRLAEVGLSQADSSEVRSHASQLVADYRELSESLAALIRRKGGLAGAPVGGTSENYQKLMAKAGSDFDREFVRTLASLSYVVMSLFERAAADVKDPDVRDLAASELPVLRAHRNTVTDLKKALD